MAKKYIRMKEVREIMNSHIPVEILKCWKMEDASLMECLNVVCTSSNFKNDTFNLKFLDSGQIRKIKGVAVFELNGMEVLL